MGECNLHCYGTACKNMGIDCENGADCNVFPEGCTSEGVVDGVDCPFFIGSASDNVLGVIVQPFYSETDVSVQVVIGAALLVMALAMCSWNKLRQKEYATI